MWSFLASAFEGDYFRIRQADIQDMQIQTRHDLPGTIMKPTYIQSRAIRDTFWCPTCAIVLCKRHVPMAQHALLATVLWITQAITEGNLQPQPLWRPTLYASRHSLCDGLHDERGCVTILSLALKRLFCARHQHLLPLLLPCTRLTAHLNLSWGITAVLRNLRVVSLILETTTHSSYLWSF